jgi:hypothetical protein
MAQPLQSINLVAPGFKGVNTEDSPIAEDFSFADVADNAVIDKRGRIASRKGVDLFTVDRTLLGDSYATQIHHFYDDAGNEEIFVTGNNKIFKTTSTVDPDDTLVDITPSGYTVTGDNWKIVNFNDKAYFFQRGLEPLVYDDATGLRTFGSATGSPTNPTLFCNEALAAYGRLFVVDSGTNTQTIYWSDLLIGTDFSGGSSGSIDVSKAWPDGYDEVRVLVAHNDKLIILGKHSVLVYGNAFSPALMALEDTVAGVGCICRNSVQSIGTDVLFMSQDGLRSFGRTIQEKSLPISDLSLNVKTELIAIIDNRSCQTASVYSPENSFYLITFPDQELTYCFDLKGRLENNAYRVTRWTGAPFKTYERKNTDGTLLVGTVDGLGKYSGYSDQFNDSGTITPNSYIFRYYSPGLTFGDPSKLKFLKKLRPTLVGANSATVFVKWAYDFGTTFSTTEFIVGNQTPYDYNTPTSEYTVAEYTGGSTVSRPPVNTTGSGSVITIGLESEINGFALSLQEINVLALMGKTL